MNNIKYYIYTDGFNDLEEYFFKDIANDRDINIISKNHSFKNKLIQKIFRFHFSFKINKYLLLPLKNLWFPFLDRNKDKDKDSISVYIFMASWYYPAFYKYLVKEHYNTKIILYFGDTVMSKQRNIPDLDIEKAKCYTDIIYSYNPKDVIKYGLKYLPLCYSKNNNVNNNVSTDNDWIDVVFIGAARNRFEAIIDSYNYCKKSGLKVFFYIVGKNLPVINSSDFIISDHPMSMENYLKKISKAKCIWEIIDSETEGSTLRFWDAVMYDKFLITNNKHVVQSEFFKTGYIIYYNDINTINFNFLENGINPSFHYSGENSPRKFISQISTDLNIHGANI